MAKKRVRKGNRIRARWAHESLRAFAQQTRQDTSGDFEHGPATVVGDLLANLMHWCDVMGEDFNACLETARMHYEAEQSAGEDPTPLGYVEPLYKEAA